MLRLLGVSSQPGSHCQFRCVQVASVFARLSSIPLLPTSQQDLSAATPLMANLHFLACLQAVCSLLV